MHIYVGVCLYLCSKFLISLCPYDPLFIYQLPPNAATAPPGLGSCAEWQRAILERFSSLRQVPHESVLRARIKVYHKHAHVYMHHEHANKHLLTHTNIYIYTHSYIYLHSHTHPRVSSCSVAASCAPSSLSEPSSPLLADSVRGFIALANLGEESQRDGARVCAFRQRAIKDRNLSCVYIA